MGRTLPSITMEFLEEKGAFNHYRRALRRADQLVLDELFNAAQVHLAEAAYAANSLPMEVFLISMLLEERKVVNSLKIEVEALKNKIEEMSSNR